ncbi:hypothetical protein BESB_073900 [Besnoitia besnoiti]|uniref:Uncharacterized protein n=1 Tax=Besnoitia besnoiti TaxID=94643 RepID=A0A2A9M6Z6_BESBE|nr:uncharacterized protein BESB_073900 [Besnoitia besnoiti]PFH34238.1 hypothetical protein BESB_073900 [Besnoitia besnoiti]
MQPVTGAASLSSPASRRTKKVFVGSRPQPARKTNAVGSFPPPSHSFAFSAASSSASAASASASAASASASAASASASAASASASAASASASAASASASAASASASAASASASAASASASAASASASAASASASSPARLRALSASVRRRDTQGPPRAQEGEGREENAFLAVDCREPRATARQARGGAAHVRAQRSRGGGERTRRTLSAGGFGVCDSNGEGLFPCETEAPASGAARRDDGRADLHGRASGGRQAGQVGEKARRPREPGGRSPRRGESSTSCGAESRAPANPASAERSQRLQGGDAAQTFLGVRGEEIRPARASAVRVAATEEHPGAAKALAGCRLVRCAAEREEAKRGGARAVSLSVVSAAADRREASRGPVEERESGRAAAACLLPPSKQREKKAHKVAQTPKSAAAARSVSATPSATFARVPLPWGPLSTVPPREDGSSQLLRAPAGADSAPPHALFFNSAPRRSAAGSKRHLRVSGRSAERRAKVLHSQPPPPLASSSALPSGESPLFASPLSGHLETPAEHEALRQAQREKRGETGEEDREAAKVGGRAEGREDEGFASDVSASSETILPSQSLSQALASFAECRLRNVSEEDSRLGSSSVAETRGVCTAEPSLVRYEAALFPPCSPPHSPSPSSSDHDEGFLLETLTPRACEKRFENVHTALRLSLPSSSSLTSLNPSSLFLAKTHPRAASASSSRTSLRSPTLQVSCRLSPSTLAPGSAPDGECTISQPARNMETRYAPAPSLPPPMPRQASLRPAPRLPLPPPRRSVSSQNSPLRLRASLSAAEAQKAEDRSPPAPAASDRRNGLPARRAPSSPLAGVGVRDKSADGTDAAGNRDSGAEDATAASPSRSAVSGVGDAAVPRRKSLEAGEARKGDARDGLGRRNPCETQATRQRETVCSADGAPPRTTRAGDDDGRPARASRPSARVGRAEAPTHAPPRPPRAHRLLPALAGDPIVSIDLDARVGVVAGSMLGRVSAHFFDRRTRPASPEKEETPRGAAAPGSPSSASSAFAPSCSSSSSLGSCSPSSRGSSPPREPPLLAALAAPARSQPPPAVQRLRKFFAALPGAERLACVKQTGERLRQTAASMLRNSLHPTAVTRAPPLHPNCYFTEAQVERAAAKKRHSAQIEAESSEQQPEATEAARDQRGHASAEAMAPQGGSLRRPRGEAAAHARDGDGGLSCRNQPEGAETLGDEDLRSGAEGHAERKMLTAGCSSGEPLEGSQGEIERKRASRGSAAARLLLAPLAPLQVLRKAKQRTRREKENEEPRPCKCLTGLFVLFAAYGDDACSCVSINPACVYSIFGMSEIVRWESKTLKCLGGERVSPSQFAPHRSSQSSTTFFMSRHPVRCSHRAHAERGRVFAGGGGVGMIISLGCGAYEDLQRFFCIPLWRSLEANAVVVLDCDGTHLLCVTSEFISGTRYFYIMDLRGACSTEFKENYSWATTRKGFMQKFVAYKREAPKHFSLAKLFRRSFLVVCDGSYGNRLVVYEASAALEAYSATRKRLMLERRREARRKRGGAPEEEGEEEDEALGWDDEELCDLDGDCGLWDADGFEQPKPAPVEVDYGKPVHTFVGHLASIVAIDAAREDDLLLSIDSDAKLFLWRWRFTAPLLVVDCSPAKFYLGWPWVLVSHEAVVAFSCDHGVYIVRLTGETEEDVEPVFRSSRIRPFWSKRFSSCKVVALQSEAPRA